MIEKIIYDFLVAKQTIPVYTEIPKTKPSRFYTIEKTGSGLSNHINSATIAIQSYGTSLLDAVQMNDNLIDLMLNDFLDLNEIGGIRKNSDYNFTDPTSKEYRYQAVFDVTYYKEA